MDGAWAKLSDIWQYRHTKGDYIKGTKNSIQKKLLTLEDGKTIYEEVKGEDVKTDRDHVLVYHGQNTVADSDVPGLVNKAVRWDSITRSVPGFSEEMLIIADLMYNADYTLTRKLNRYLVEEGVGRVDHVSQAINRSENQFIRKKEKQALLKALQRFFSSFGVNVPMNTLVNQWSTCRDWQRRRVSFAHPLDGSSLDMMKTCTKSI